jgi:hypothetical protein
MSKPGKRKEMWASLYFLRSLIPKILTKLENIMDFLSDTQFIAATANVATLLFAVVIVLQILLAAGIIPVSIAWGGRQPKLTASLRIASIIAAILLGAFIFVIRYRAGLFGSGPITALLTLACLLISASNLAI